jgi:hypothetical protein
MHACTRCLLLIGVTANFHANKGLVVAAAVFLVTVILYLHFVFGELHAVALRSAAIVSVPALAKTCGSLTVGKETALSSQTRRQLCALFADAANIGE